MTREELEAWHAAHPYGPRDEAYVDAMLVVLRAKWLAAPHQRLGQLVYNHCRGKAPIFYLKDEAFLDD